jgi:two-component system KDP operon response regulator KdpE
MTRQAVTPPIPEARVLVVDDEPNVRSALTRSLTLLGYRADAASSGRQALGLLQRVTYDLMVLDLRMPGMDGVEVMQRARQVRPNLLIIVLTGHATLESAIAAVKSHATDYLIKPTSLHDVAAAVAAALQKRAEVLRRQYLLKVMDQTLDALREGEATDTELPTLERFLHVGPVTLDSEKRLIVVGDSPARSAELTENEMSILAYLMGRPDRVVSSRELAHAALGYDVTEQEARTIIRPHIFRLRRKVETDPKEPRLVRTVRGRGYLFVS